MLLNTNQENFRRSLIPIGLTCYGKSINKGSSFTTVGLATCCPIPTALFLLHPLTVLSSITSYQWPSAWICAQ